MDKDAELFTNLLNYKESLKLIIMNNKKNDIRLNGQSVFCG